MVGANTGAGELDAVDAGDDDDETVETVAADGTVTGIVLPGADVLDDDEDSDGVDDGVCMMLYPYRMI